MNKKLINLIALLMAAVITLSVPLTAGAITFSGGYGTLNYIAHVNLWTNRVRSDISTSSNADLYVITTVRFAVEVSGEILPATTGVTKHASANSTNYVDFEKTYTYYMNVANFPNVGFFYDCYFTDKINDQYLLQGYRVFS